MEYGAPTLGLREIRRLLRDHARTFDITLCSLPCAFREPLSLAYLLARASDTVADASGIDREQRLVLLEELQEALETESFRWETSSIQKQLSASETELLASVPMLMEALARHPDRVELVQLWRTVLKGQLFDMRRFIPEAPPLTHGELEEYCWLVAGSVGENWTRLIAKHAPWTLLRPTEELVKLGISYGKGLQLLNILRDRSADRELGRMYIQKSDWPEMMTLAEEWLDQGGQYCAALRPGRIRYASELPLRLARRTLVRMHQMPEGTPVKIMRWEIYEILLRTLPSLVLPGANNPAS